MLSFFNCSEILTAVLGYFFRDWICLERDLDLDVERNIDFGCFDLICRDCLERFDNFDYFDWVDLFDLFEPYD